MSFLVSKIPWQQKNMKLPLLILALVLTTFSLQGQKLMANKEYKARNPINTVAWVPYFNEDKVVSELNEQFYQAFKKGFSVADPEQILHNMTHHRAFNEIVRETTGFEAHTLKHNLNLFDPMTDEQVAVYKANFMHTDVLIIGSSIKSRTLTKINGSGNISVSGWLTIFDLRTGEFIVSIFKKVKKKFDTITSETMPPTKELFEYLYDKVRSYLK